MKFYFVVFEGWPGVETALRCVESAVKDMFPDADTKFLNLISNGRLDVGTIRTIQSDPADFLFLGGWDNNVKTIILNIPRNKTKSILLWCSPITQMELGGEIDRFADVWSLLDQGKIDKLAILLDTDAEVLHSYNKNVIYTPVFMKTKDMDGIEAKYFPEGNGFVNTNIFCAPCPRKNIMSQLIALSTLRESDLMIHTNYNMNNIVKQYFMLANHFFRKNLANHSWMSRNYYLGIIKGMDFASQITLSESFNYTAAEHMYFGVPTMLSFSSPIAKYSMKDLGPIIISKPDDISEIVSIASKLVLEKNFRYDMGQKAKHCINILNKRNFDTLKENLSGIFRGDI